MKCSKCFQRLLASSCIFLQASDKVPDKVPDKTLQPFQVHLSVDGTFAGQIMPADWWIYAFYAFTRMEANGSEWNRMEQDGAEWKNTTE